MRGPARRVATTPAPHRRFKAAEVAVRAEGLESPLRPLEPVGAEDEQRSRASDRYQRVPATATRVVREAVEREPVVSRSAVALAHAVAVAIVAVLGKERLNAFLKVVRSRGRGGGGRIRGERAHPREPGRQKRAERHP